MQNPLSESGYCMVALPKTDIAPLDLLYKTPGGVSTLGATLTELFKPVSVAPPEPKQGVVPDIVSSGEMSLDAKVSVNILKTLLEKLGLGKFSAETGIDSNYIITASYSDVQRLWINLVQLDNYVSTAMSVREGFNSMRGKLEENELYIVTEVLTTPHVTIKIEAKNGIDVSADAAFEGILNSKASVARKVNNSLELDYNDGQNPLVFAIKAQQIIYDRGSFWKEPNFTIEEKGGYVVLGNEEMPTHPLQAYGETVDI